MCSTENMPNGLLPIVLHSLRLHAPIFWRARTDEGLSELQRLARLAGQPDTLTLRWAVPPEAAHSLQQWLTEQSGLPPQTPVLFVFPTGAPSSASKRWPMENYQHLLDDFAQTQQAIIVVNVEPESQDPVQPLLRSLRAAAKCVLPFVDRDLHRLVALLSLAKAAIGNDTGPAHIAQALGVPTVVLQGGGCWPAYAAWGPAAVSLVNPLPCFGCNWNCAFGRGYCVEAIPTAEASKALLAAWNGELPRAQSIELHTIHPAQAEAMGLAANNFAAADKGRRRQFAVNQELEYGLAAERGHAETVHDMMERDRVAREHERAQASLMQVALSAGVQRLAAATEVTKQSLQAELQALQAANKSLGTQLAQEQSAFLASEQTVSQLREKRAALEQQLLQGQQQAQALKERLQEIESEGFWKSFSRTSRKLLNQ